MEGFLVIGDSLSVYGWPEVVAHYSDYYIQNISQNGRLMVNTVLPEWINASEHVQTIILALGSNDAFWAVSEEDYRSAVAAFRTAAESQGWTVVGMLPNQPTNFPVDMTMYRDVMTEELAQVIDAPIISYIEDDVHPDAWGKMWQAFAAKEFMDAL